MSGGRERRLVFGEVAEQYDRARPDYPDALFADALSFAEFQAGERVLEVGAGTGKATAGYVAAGAQVVALEPSEEMAAVARSRLVGAAGATIVEQSFEAWTVDACDYSVVGAAQSWHWVDPATRLAKAQSVLRRGGAVALCWNQPEYPDAALRRALDAAYRELAPTTVGRFARGTPRPLDGQDTAIDELRDSTRFADFTIREYRHPVGYDARAYVDLLGTHSDHRMLEPDDRDRLLGRIESLIDAAGSITVDYCTTLALARRV